MPFENDIKKRGRKKKRKKTSVRGEEIDEDLIGIANLFQEQGDDDDVSHGSDGRDRTNFDDEEEEDDDEDDEEDDDEEDDDEEDDDEEDDDDDDDDDDDEEEEDNDSSSEVNNVPVKQHRRMPITGGYSSLAENNEPEVAPTKKKKNEGQSGEKSGRYNDGKIVPNEKASEGLTEGRSKKETKRSAPQDGSEYFISKDFIKKVGQLNNIINRQIIVESDSSFLQISNIIELRVRQIIEEANKFYQKRKRYCINRFLNLNDFTNSCHYLNVRVPYRYQVSLHEDLYPHHEGMKNWRVRCRLVSKRGFKNVKNRMKKKKRKKGYLQKGRKRKRRNNFNLSAAKIFKEFQTQQNRRTNCYREIAEGEKGKEKRSRSEGPSGWKGGDSYEVEQGPRGETGGEDSGEIGIQGVSHGSGHKAKAPCSSRDIDEMFPIGVNDLFGAQRENEKEEKERGDAGGDTGGDAAEESVSLPDDPSSEDNPEVNVSVEREGGNPCEDEEAERNCPKGAAESGSSQSALSVNEGQDEQKGLAGGGTQGSAAHHDDNQDKGHDHSASDLLAEIARNVESEDIGNGDPLRSVKEGPPEGEGLGDEKNRDEEERNQDNGGVESDNVVNGDVPKDQSCTREGPHLEGGGKDNHTDGIETQSGEEDDHLLHYKLYFRKNRSKIKNIEKFLLSDMQNVLPVEANMTIFWLFIQNRCKKRKKKKKRNGQSSSVGEDYYYACGAEGSNERRKSASVHFDYQCYEMLYRVDRRGRNFHSYRGYARGGGLGDRHGDSHSHSHLDRHLNSQSGNIFLLPKFYPINKEYAILSKYILEIIKDIINYRVNFFDYNNILHIFTTSKEINKILANIFFFLFNELDHNLAFNNMYASLMLLILLDGIIKNKNIDTHFYCLQILKMLIHVIIYEHDLKLKNIYLILLVKRKACDIMINFCSVLRKKNNNEIINIDYYLIYILSKLLTHRKCTYMHIYVSYYLIYLMPLNIHLKFFLAYTPNFLGIFFKKYYYHQNVYCNTSYRLLVSSEEIELNELFNFFFFHIYTLIQGSLYRIFKHMDNILVLNNATTCSYLNYLMDFIIQYADYHLPLLLSIMTVLGRGSAALISGAARRKRGSKRLRGHPKRMHSRRQGETLRSRCSDRGKKSAKIRRKRIKKNRLKKERRKKAKKGQRLLDLGAVRAYEQEHDVQKLAKRKNYLKHVKKIYDYYARQKHTDKDDNVYVGHYNNEDDLNDLDDRGDLISTENMNTTYGNKKGFLTAYVEKRILLNKTLLQNMMHRNQLHANIAVNRMLCKILNKFEKKRNRKVSRRRSRDDGLLLYNSCYYFLYTL
ncbi:hypothetical protein C922_02658 [Plasmodium inui San Antonio 1]|uniref:Uncharacterized protein n=1 Tax=Plasmodium inui San Antonio 1 TaxID=1237626 RepID=W7ADF5_9APIC|nr:hypothetical protein C922_02658 [Plasmodium inui San Antonio 1]EUD67074.1 hypothetical protein C922_02658 [Plasmodium inui San Antonio 1]